MRSWAGEVRASWPHAVLHPFRSIWHGKGQWLNLLSFEVVLEVRMLFMLSGSDMTMRVNFWHEIWYLTCTRQ